MLLVSGWHTCESLEASVTLVRDPPPTVSTGVAAPVTLGEECQARSSIVPALRHCLVSTKHITMVSYHHQV